MALLVQEMDNVWHSLLPFITLNTRGPILCPFQDCVSGDVWSAEHYLLVILPHQGQHGLAGHQHGLETGSGLPARQGWSERGQPAEKQCAKLFIFNSDIDRILGIFSSSLMPQC